MKSYKSILIVFFSLFFIGCASSYKAINPTSISYSAFDLKDGINFSYRYDVLSESGNKKYAKKEEKNNIKIIAVHITNNNDSTINISKDLQFYSGNNPILIMSPLAIKNQIKQSVASYLLYLLLTPMKLYITKNEGLETTTETYSIGYIIGPGITIGNLIMASSANEEFLKELIQYNINNIELKKGESVYGIIGIKESGYNPLTVKRK